MVSSKPPAFAGSRFPALFSQSNQCHLALPLSYACSRSRLPFSYSPDLNPIEMGFAKLKAHLRRIGARTIDALWSAIGDICALCSEHECWNYLKDAGYAPN
jgi:hypothetical protein